MISAFLHAHIVETESSKAVSMCAKTVDGASVFCLVKPGKDEHVTAELKVLGSSKAEGQGIADAVAEALGDLVL